MDGPVLCVTRWRALYQMISVRCGYWSFPPVRTERPDTVGDATGDKGTLGRVYEQGGTHESPEAIRVGGGGGVERLFQLPAAVAGLVGMAAGAGVDLCQAVPTFCQSPAQQRPRYRSPPAGRRR